MKFNADKSEEIMFSGKRKQPFYPPVELESQDIARKNEHKYLGVILDSKLNCQSHVREAVIKARRIGLTKYLVGFLSLTTSMHYSPV